MNPIFIRRLTNYVRRHLPSAKLNIKNLTVEIDGRVYEIVSDEEEIFNKDFWFLPAYEFVQVFKDGKYTTELARKPMRPGVDGWFYEFGGRFYIQLNDETTEDPTLTEALYIGEYISKIPNRAFLGIHSGYDLCSGVGMYEDWIKKAKFLGIKTLAICERHTLAGMISFQKSCQKAGIKPIIGCTFTIFEGNHQQFDVKMYAKNTVGFQNILRMLTRVNVEEKHLDKDFLFTCLEGCVLVLDPKTMPFTSTNCFQGLPDVYYMVDTVKFEVPGTDEVFVNNFERFLKSDFQPVAITDAYYIEQRDSLVREVLFGVAKQFDERSYNQYFKTKAEYIKEFAKMFDPNCKAWVPIIKKALANEAKVARDCNFLYETAERRLPKYKLTPEEKEKFGTKQALFLHLIKTGMQERGLSFQGEYGERLQNELRVIKKGQVMDYFLILWDIIKWSRSQGIIVGPGRGSAGGSLLSYILDIIKINPLDFGLIFERFLNEGRIGTLEPCRAFKLELEDGRVLEFNEGELIRVERNGVEYVLPAEELKEDDTILNF